MSILKKLLGCTASFIAGMCGLALSACTGMIVEGTAGSFSVETITKAYKVLTDSSLYSNAKAAGATAEFVRMKIFAIFTLAISILLIAYSIIMLLKNLNVIKIKSKIFNIIGLVLVASLLVATTGLLITSNIYANCAIELTKVGLIAKGIPAATIALLPINVVGKVGVYLPLMLTISIITTFVYALALIIKRKKS